MHELIKTDVLIIGSGIGGGITALQLAEHGIPVTVLTRSDNVQCSNTYQAQGGIVYKGKKDTPELLIEDIEKAGAGLCNPKSVRIVAEEGPGLVESILIDKLGIQFDTDKKGNLSLAREGAHTVPRILHVTDATGRTIASAIYSALKENPNIKLLTNATAIDLLTPSHHSINRLEIYKPRSCIGVYFLDQSDGKVKRCVSRYTVIATGGLGQIYLRTTNPAGARGDGLAMAYRAGASVINSEFIQFHPTTFFYRGASQFLISEAVRGKGARLVNADGKPFMQKYAPELKDLAPRDIVSRSIHEEMLLTDSTNVYMDMYSYISQNSIKRNFPNIYRNCLEFGIDATKELIPVVPAAHYACGGIWVNKWGKTSLERLYAVGEVACTGVHGANRLASVSLLEGLVWGKRIAKNIIKHIDKISFPKPVDIPTWREDSTFEPDPALISQDMSYIKNIMWNYVGLIRSKRRLLRAMSELRNLETEIEKFYRATRVTDNLIGLRNAVRTAIIITSAAWENKNSIGCHYRQD